MVVNVFNLSGSHPKGNQSGTVMAMACMGNENRFLDDILSHDFKEDSFNFTRLKNQLTCEQDAFDMAASLQKATEIKLTGILQPFIASNTSKNVCYSGGVVLNSVFLGKLYHVFSNNIAHQYVCPVPSDAGLCIGAAQMYWHHHKKNPPPLKNNSPYLGFYYNQTDVYNAIDQVKNEISIESTSEEDVLTHISNAKIVALYGGKSESGRRALGNRSIIADPRNPQMKDLINDKVKHRQWYRPFAPAILEEATSEWFERHVASPYMSFVIPFKPFAKDKVPAVFHFDKTGRLQTVSKELHPWFHQFLTKWHSMSNVPILLNTSFNDREPIVETPLHALTCFLGTNIDYLYFYDHKLLVQKINPAP